MTDTLTLAQLRTRSRERADMVGSTFITDSELNGYINYSYKELYDLLVEAVQDYKLTSTTFSITTGNTWSLPSDFYKMRGLDDLTNTARPRTVRKFNFAERNDFVSDGLVLSSYEFSDVTYRITGDTLLIMPPENAVKPYKFWYVPTLATLTADGDTADGVQGWLEYVIVDAAIKMLVKEESDTRALEKSKNDLRERITRMRDDRDQTMPEKVARIRNRRRGSMYPYVGEYYP